VETVANDESVTWPATGTLDVTREPEGRRGLGDGRTHTEHDGACQDEERKSNASHRRRTLADALATFRPGYTGNAAPSFSACAFSAERAQEP
jgi:hypothetical protein